MDCSPEVGCRLRRTQSLPHSRRRQLTRLSSPHTDVQLQKTSSCLDVMQGGSAAAIQNSSRKPSRQDSDGSEPVQTVSQLLIESDIRRGDNPPSPTCTHAFLIRQGSLPVSMSSYTYTDFESDYEGHISTCEICYDTKPNTEFVVRPCCGDQSSDLRSTCCKDCMTQYVRTQLSEGNVRMRCPQPDCTNGMMEVDDVRPYVADSQMEFFNRLIIIKSSDPNVRLCPRCSKATPAPTMLKRSTRKGTKITCEECEFIWCFECESPWHSSSSCTKARKGGKLFRQWLKHRTGDVPNGQRCPKCRIPIQRSTGCNQMTCTRCHTRFCYRCGDRMLDLGILGDHYDRYSIAGCRYNLLPDSGVKRRAVRAGALTAGITIGVPLVVGAGAVVVAVVLAASPFYGTYKLGKKIVREI